MSCSCDYASHFKCGLPQTFLFPVYLVTPLLDRSFLWPWLLFCLVNYQFICSQPFSHRGRLFGCSPLHHFVSISPLSDEQSFGFRASISEPVLVSGEELLVLFSAFLAAVIRLACSLHSFLVTQVVVVICFCSLMFCWIHAAWA